MRTSDAMGAGLSGLCLLHCLGLPLVISLIPSVTWMENELTHVAMAALALLLVLNAVPAWPRGRARHVLCAIAALGLSLLFYGAFAEIGEAAERIVTTIGALALASAHVIAWRRTRNLHSV